MANEFVIKNGFIGQGNSIVNATFSANTIQILTPPTLNNSNTQILSRNSSTGAIEFSTLSAITTDNFVTGGTYSNGILTLDRQNGSVTISGFLSADTFVTGFTYDNQNRLTLSQNNGQSDLNLYINQFSGLSINGISLPNGYALSVTGDSIFNGDVYVNGDLNYNGNLIVTGSTIIQNGLTANTIYTDYIDFNTSYTGQTLPAGRLQWDNGNGTLVLGLKGGLSNMELGLENMALCYNADSVTLTAGTIIYVSGSQGNRPAIKRALATNDGYSVTTLGMVSESIAVGAEGFVTTYGMVNNLGTYGLTGGTALWLSPTILGGYTDVKPQAPNHTVLIGYVVRVPNNPSQMVGSIFVNISNGWELDELHDVRISGATEGDLLIRSSYSGSPVWINSKTLNGDYTINGELTITGSTNVSYIDFDTTLSGTTAAEGRLFWDVNNRTLSLGMIGGPVQQIGEEQYYLVEAASNILDGRVVGAVGTTGASGRILADYIIADGSIPAVSTMGILTQNLNAGDIGYVTNFGLVRGLDTTGIPYGETWSDGDFLYVSPYTGGTLTNIKPTAPNLEILVALVIYANASNGSIFVRPKIGESLQTLYDVAISGTTNGDLLVYNSTNNLWENGKDLTGNYTIGGNLNVTSGITVNSLSASTIELYTQPTNNNSNTELLTRNSSTGIVEYKDVSSLIDVHVTGFTYNDSNKLTISRNEGLPNLDVYINNMSGLTVNGVLSATTINSDTINSLTITGQSFTITTQSQDNSLENFLVLDSSGNFFTRTFDSLNYIPNLVTVSMTGGTSDFTSIKLAVDSITGASSTNPYVVKVGPGIYNEDPITMKSYVAIIGESSVSTIVNAKDSNQSLFYAKDQTFISDLLIQGCTGTSVAAVLYSSSTVSAANAIVYIENVRFGANYTHVKNNPFGGGNTAVQCTNIKYGAQPFTLGFYMTSDGSSTGRFQLRNVTTTAGGVTNTTGLTFAKVDQPNCTIIGNLVTVTKAGSAPVSGIGFHVENGGLLRLNTFNIQRFGTGIYVPQVGSAPTIDAVGLNFENCTTDVDIIHSGTTGKVNGTDSFLKTKINIDAPIYEVGQDPRLITVAKKGGDFSSIKSAVDYLVASGNTSSSNRYVINVGPGEYVEDEIDLTQTPYVSVVGSNIQTTLITPSGSTQHIFKIGQNNEISFLSIANAPSGYAAIYAYDIGDFGQGHKISIYDCDIGLWVESDTQDTIFYGEYIDMNGNFTYGTKVIGNNGYGALANLENYYLFPTGTGTQIGNRVVGTGATINITSSSFQGNLFTGSTAIEMEDTAFLNMAATDVFDWGDGVKILNTGGPSSFEINGSTFTNNVLDINVEQSTATGVFLGISSHEKINTASSEIYWNFLDSDDGELDITRKGSVTFPDGSHTDFTTLIFEGGSMGLMSGGSITTISGTTVEAVAGFGYVEKSDNSGIIRRIDWANNQVVLLPNSDLYISIDENSNINSSASRPNSFYNIILGRVVTNTTDVEFIDLSPFNAEHTSNRYDNLFTEAMGPIYAFGSIVTEGTTPFTLDVTAGEYYYSTNEFLPLGGNGITFVEYYRAGTGSTWVTSATTIVNNTQYDSNGVLSALTTGYYTKHTLYTVGDGSYEHYFLVLGQNEYGTLVEAEDAGLPTPPTYFSDGVTQIANIYIQQGSSGFTQVEDIRPTIGFRAGGVNASSVHGNLLGLNSDDHQQYLLVNGVRAMIGDLNMGTFDVTNVGLVDGVTVSAHATRHQFGGSDPVGSSTPLANAIPYADGSGRLDSWVSTATTTTLGLVKLSTSPVLASDPIVVGDNDFRLLRAITGGTFNNSINTLVLTTNNGDLINISGFTSTDFYVTGGTFNSGTNTLTLDRQNGSVIITGFTSSSSGDNYVTGGTYSLGTLTLDRQNGSVSVTGFTTGIKAGTVAGASFSGNPKKFTVTFTSAYPNTNYSITITGAINRSFTWESKLANGFTINSNANTSFTEDVNWITMSYGEF